MVWFKQLAEVECRRTRMEWRVGAMPCFSCGDVLRVRSQTHTLVGVRSISQYVSPPRLLAPWPPLLPLPSSDPQSRTVLSCWLQNWRNQPALKRIVMLLLGWPAWPLSWAGYQLYSDPAWAAVCAWTLGLYASLGLHFTRGLLPTAQLVGAGIGTATVFAAVWYQDRAQRSKDEADLRSWNESAAKLQQPEPILPGLRHLTHTIAQRLGANVFPASAPRGRAAVRRSWSDRAVMLWPHRPPWQTCAAGQQPPAGFGPAQSRAMRHAAALPRCAHGATARSCCCGRRPTC